MNTTRSILPFIFALVVLPAGALAADPTGRIAVGPDTTPGDQQFTYRITQPGSYYLKADLIGASGKSGIFIDSGGVTLDLNGMTVVGDSTGSRGIVAYNIDGPVRICDGTVRNWGTGIYAFNAALQLESISVCDNGGNGIELVDVDGVLANCAASENGGTGISAWGSNNWTTLSIENCSSSRNGAGFHVKLSVLRGCRALFNERAGFNIESSTLVDKHIDTERQSGDPCVPRQNPELLG